MSPDKKGKKSNPAEEKIISVGGGKKKQASQMPQHYKNKDNILKANSKFI